MSVLRQDPTTGEWVIIAPRRRHRPHAPPTSRATSPSADCPLCPGHEDQTPPELWRLPAQDSGLPWQVRVVENRFAMLSPDDRGAERADPSGLLRERPGSGHHELIIESPVHGARLAALGTTGLASVVEAYHARYRALHGDRRVAYVIIFRNSGERAGASLGHPHSQLVAAPMVPLVVEARLERARVHFTRTGRSLYGDLVDAELGDGRRVVLESPHFVAFCPFASGAAFETWIVPRRQVSSFGATTADERRDLAGVLETTLRAVDAALREPPFNYVLHTAPLTKEEDSSYRWHLRILPRIDTLAGFELGSGVRVNPTSPEEAAALLRSAPSDSTKQGA